ncbi:hypothetical protein T07_3095 [Trichinella nelsoni]|uniref:Uncharacterized protein n=1 Tax=Trichinella nelsoni TaxID=6336 RepID=A0A0V0RSY1_9BILA|nr:hypothetical protein T07_3095 [Trichinella nelsoni]
MRSREILCVLIISVAYCICVTWSYVSCLDVRDYADQSDQTSISYGPRSRGICAEDMNKLTNLKVQVTGLAGKDEFSLYYVIMLSLMSVLLLKRKTLAQLIFVSSMNDTSVELTATSKSATENC